METPYANHIILAVFILGIICCLLALLTIRITPALQNSFGVLCTWQMYADIAQLALITGYCLLGADAAPKPHALPSIIACQTIETLYFFTGQLHVLMAVHRFVYVLAPRFTRRWKSSTTKMLLVCTTISIARILLMTALDTGMYWVYDRATALWFITETPWTHFYEMYLELAWSIGEMAAILVLDGITLSHLISWRAMMSRERAQNHKHIETRLVLQSFCQCVPTAAVTILYFLVFPNIKSQFIQFMCSSFVLSFGNVLDAIIILIFHLRFSLFRKNAIGAITASATPAAANYKEASTLPLIPLIVITYLVSILWSACFEISFGKIEMLLLEGHRMREDTTEEDENKQRLDPLKAGDGVLEAEEWFSIKELHSGADMQTTYADEITLAVFIFGMICCILALLTIRRAVALQNSFGVLCKWQMYGDMAQLVLITFYCLLSEKVAPGPHHVVSIVACQSIETLYFFSGELHVLMAVHRITFIMAPKRAKAWKSATSWLIIFCTATSIVRILGMTAFDRGMYWVYDRPTSLWYITETPWTEFYEMYLELGWSIFEMVAILMLDGVTLTQLIIWRSEIISNQVTHRHAEARLVLQSLCQCVPTASITILYFLVFPTIESQFIQFMCSSFVLAFGNVLDAVIILAFHMRWKLFRKNVIDVTVSENTLAGNSQGHP
ncbi:hypothetical protein PRIPAC_77098 [Pristionchus pacificus]|uniref:G protein-coupled receptor n=1 Tax=Pristionchus pacificus TaxID=54126 RepID=A0A2A6CM78_PRIPA|nr:hypothetical protein PRIPAC_77098 [Pristionchus pacificus]|eukprot:PDM79216.1 G protein-coupled receptor [Pristionchus pacificus]